MQKGGTKVLVIIIRTKQVFYLCGVAVAKLLVSIRTNGYQMKEEDLLYSLVPCT